MASGSVCRNYLVTVTCAFTSLYFLRQQPLLSRTLAVEGGLLDCGSCAAEAREPLLHDDAHDDAPQAALLRRARRRVRHDGRELLGLRAPRRAQALGEGLGDAHRVSLFAQLQQRFRDAALLTASIVGAPKALPCCGN